MESFGPEIRFGRNWRSYQARVLEELGGHLEDNHLHVVAAPGSGKTVLGLEVMRRLDKPTLILSPTLAIRDQWVDRLDGMFCEGRVDIRPWVSKDVTSPKFLTVSTYQGLHSAYTRGVDIDFEEDEEEDGGRKGTARGPKQSGRSLIAKLKKAGVGTIVVDEAHHLRSEWWKCLIDVKRSLDGPTVIALTATPPYDVGQQEWARYKDLCGPVDAEISVPELVWRKDLCPHQDCVFLSAPAKSELKQVWDFRRRVAGLCRYILAHEDFVRAIETHPCVARPQENIERVLDDPEFCSAMAIFLKRAGRRKPGKLLKILGVERRRVPRLTLEWIETLLTGCLFEHAEDFVAYEELFERLRTDARRIGAIENGKVVLRVTRAITKMLRTSISKLESIGKIVWLESQVLGADLRMVILTDYIRKAEMPKGPGDEMPLEKIGVVPIFEKIRREGLDGIRLGILSGSLVVIPMESRQQLENIAGRIGIASESLRFRKLSHDERFVTVEIGGRDRQQMVRLITKLFNEGGITVMVGTKSLLGEGWDAPSINSLILASFVGSYMLSNQMRGRAIRVQHGNPDKTANIWHPVCVETHLSQAGEDLEMLARRFKAFVGVSVYEPVITNGIERLGLHVGSYGRGRIEELNEQTVRRAVDRQALRQAWDQAFAAGEEGRLTEEVRVPVKGLPRSFVFRNTIRALLAEGVFLLLMWLGAQGRTEGGGAFWFTVSAGGVIGALAALPYFLKAGYLFVRHGSAGSSIKQIGRAVLVALGQAGVVKGDLRRMRIAVRKNHAGWVRCSLVGGTQFDRSVFMDAMQEVLAAIDNPRYLLVRKSRLLWLKRRDYHAVPTALGRRREDAECFAKLWSRYVGPMELVYTRSQDGRATLIRARGTAMSAAFVRWCDRVKVWR